MKKLLSILLALIMCTGLLISCDNGDVTSSSEVQSQSESVSESQTESVSESQNEIDSEQVTEENTKWANGVPKEVVFAEDGFDLDDMPYYDSKAHSREYYDLLYYSWGYEKAPEKRIYTSYEELSAVLDNQYLTGLESDFFEKSCVCVVQIDYSYLGDQDAIGFYNLTSKNGELSINYDIGFVNATGSAVYSTEIAYICVPRSLVESASDTSNIAVNSVYFKSSRFNDN